MARTKKTIAQRAYEKELRNLRNRIKTVAKQGLEVNLDIQELASRQYSSNVAANRAALNKMRKLTNEILKRSSSIQSYKILKDNEVIKVLNPKEYADLMEAKRLEKKQLAKERRSAEYRAKKERIEEIRAEERARAEKNERPVDYIKAEQKGRAKDELFIENFEKGWRASYEDLVVMGEKDEDLQRFKAAMEWVYRRGFYTKLQILNRANKMNKDMVTQVFDSDEPTENMLNMSVLIEFIEFLTNNYGYNEAKELKKQDRTKTYYI